MPNYPFTNPDVLTFQEVLLLMSLMATTRSLTQSFVGWYLKREHTEVITKSDNYYGCETNAVLPSGKTALSLNGNPACTVKYHDISKNIKVIPLSLAEGPQDSELYTSSHLKCSPVFHISSKTDLDDTIKVIIQTSAVNYMRKSRFSVWCKEIGGEWYVLKTADDIENIPECDGRPVSFETDKLGHYIVVLK